MKHVGEHKQWEDDYGATVFATFARLSEAFTIAEDENYAHLNVPVWLNYIDDDDEQYGEPALEIGMLMPRHGRVWQYVGPATPEQVREIEERVLRVWMGRAEARFDRWNAKFKKVPA